MDIHAIRKTVHADEFLNRLWQDQLKTGQSQDFAMYNIFTRYIENNANYYPIYLENLKELGIPDQTEESRLVTELLDKIGYRRLRDGLLRAIEIRHKQIGIYTGETLDKLEAMPRNIRY